MTARELIERLGNVDPDLPVWILEESNDVFVDAGEVRVLRKHLHASGPVVVVCGAEE